MDKKKKAEDRKLRKKAIKLQNNSSRKLSLTEAMVIVQNPTE
jgi:hypothetical protein